MQATSLDNPQTLNLYNYCGNDPINRTDPDGQSWLSKLWKAIKFIVKVIIAVVVSILAVVSFMHGDVYGGLQFLQKALDAWGDVFKNDLLHKMARMLSIALGGYDYLKGAFSQGEGKKRGSFFALVGAIAGLFKTEEKQTKDPCKGKTPFYSAARKKKILDEHTPTGKANAGKSVYNSQGDAKGQTTKIWDYIVGKNTATFNNNTTKPIFQPDTGNYQYFKDFNFEIGRTPNKDTLTINVLIVDKNCNVMTSHPD
jgi:hypothetical protein